MTLSLTGSTISGLAVGGLPDAIVDNDMLASPKIYAYISFNGTGTAAIRNSYNVSSITDGGTGTFTINFTNNLPTEYATLLTADGVYNGAVTSLGHGDSDAAHTKAGYVKIECRGGDGSASLYDNETFNVLCIR
tara:strand:- start:271 stop:672 length:402 start_codon:yes stop_codon:yes gene_type:complete